MAVGNADYKLVYVDAGSFSSQSDGGVIHLYHVSDMTVNYYFVS